MKILKIIVLIITGYSCASQGTNNDIVLINTDTLSRKDIAAVIVAINKFNPKVIAIDLQFPGHKEYSHDLSLLLAFEECKNLVLPSVIKDFNGLENGYASFANRSSPIFLLHAKTGFVNTILEGDDLMTLKRFSTHETVGVNVEYHFGVRVAIVYDSLRAMNFVRSNEKILNINYRKENGGFKKISYSDIVHNKVSLHDIDGKIVMLGFLGPGYDDKFFTPLNLNPSEPDIYGVEYLANIVAQVLDYR
jgi:CHASE2 domain-containing sensor protein